MNFHGGYFGKENLLDFSVNIPTLPYPDGLHQELISALDQLRHYPEIDGESARRAISYKTGVDAQNIILGNGATELIYLFSRSVEIEKAMTLDPTFTEYRRALELNGVETLSMSILMNDSIDEQTNQEVLVDQYKIIEVIEKESIDLLVLCNPNNPTGHFYDKGFIEFILKNVKDPNFKLFIDESFLDFVSEETLDGYESFMMNLVDKYNVFLLRSMTKNYEVPGLRIGYGIGNKEIINQMYKYKEPWSLNSLALVAIPYLIGQNKHLLEVKKWCFEETNYLYDQLSKIPQLGVYKSTANFIMLVVPDKLACRFFDLMLTKKIYIRKCEDFIGLNQKHYRIAVRERIENDKLIKAIMEVFNEN